jgi:hypothetical protein
VPYRASGLVQWREAEVEGRWLSQRPTLLS